MADEQPGVECIECDQIFYGRDSYGRDLDECEHCGSYDVTPVVVSECPDPSGECQDEAHHWGIGKHVAEKG